MHTSKGPGLVDHAIAYSYYYAFPITLKALSVVPGFSTMYARLRDRKRGVVRLSRKKMARLCDTIRLAKRYCGPDDVILDLGTAWYFKVGVGLHLAGFRRLVLYDVQDNASVDAVRSYVGVWRRHLDQLADASGREPAAIVADIDALERCTSKAEVIERLGATHIIAAPGTPRIAPASCALIISDCVLPHVHRDLIEPELAWLRDCLRPGGRMYHIIGHDDHLMYGFRGGNLFQHYAYSDRFYAFWFQNAFQYINRFTMSDYQRLFERQGLRVVEREIVSADPAELGRVRRVDAAFADRRDEEMSVRISSWVLERVNAESP